mmetsp:Transcript_78093/g.242123  ORF Transcript_78093/g.242123 Transcript_78093/m.242123 type:complete len:139 (+) Transcript_78093:108-524(+)
MSPQAAPRTRAVALALLLLATGTPAMTFPKRLHGEAKQLQESSLGTAPAQQGAKGEEATQPSLAERTAKEATSDKAQAPLQPAAPDEVLEEELAPPATSLLQESLQLERRKPANTVCDEHGCTSVPAAEHRRPKHEEF